MPYSTATNARIFYEASGTGPALVLVHAIPFDHRLWMFQVARLSQFYRVIAMDLRGFGLSDKPETPFTLHDMAEDVLGVCRTEGVNRAILAGISIGSGIAMLIALEHPGFPRALVLVGANSRGGGRIQRRIDGFTSGDLAGYRQLHMRDLFAPDFPETPLGRWTFNMFNEASSQLSGQPIAQVFRARAGCTMTPRLDEIAVPTLVINGAHDGSLASGTETARAIRHAEHVIIPGTGHACCIEDPLAFDAAMIGFLQNSRLWP